MKRFFLEILLCSCMCISGGLYAQQNQSSGQMPMSYQQINEGGTHTLLHCQTGSAPDEILREIIRTSRTGGPYTIPVVVHIYYDTLGMMPVPSCTDVVNALEGMNLSFNALSNDTAGICSLFKPLIGNAQITFKLARLDELGNCMSGIQYHYTSVPFNPPFAPLNTNHYFNIHVCGVPSHGTYPVAYSPIPNPLDGIFVGGIGYGPLMAHEAGHWLGLFHTFGNVNQVGVCGDDLVGDTPPTDGSPGTCDTNRSVCNPGIVENVQNYMDYSSCYKMFTIGQVNRMQGILDDTTLSRREIYTPANLVLTGVNPQPVCGFTAGFIAFRTGTVPCTYNSTVRAVMTQFTTVPDSVHWSIPGGTPSVHWGTDLDVYFAVSGTYTITMTAYSNGVASTSSRTMHINRHPLDEVTSYPFTENFEGGFSFPDNHVQPAGGAGGWQLNNSVGYNSSTSMYVPQETGTGTDLNTLNLGIFDLDSLDQPYLSFRIASAFHSQSIRHKLLVKATNICNNSSYTLELLYDSMMALTNTPGNFIPSTAAQWKQVKVNLSFLTHFFVDDDILLSIILEKDFTAPGQDQHFYLDNINLNDSSDMLPPVANFSIENKDFCYNPCYDIEFVDRSTNMPSSWNWQGLGANVYTPVVDGCYSVFPIDSVPITLIVSNDFGSDTAVQYIYTRTPAPFNITPSAYTICEGDTVMMSAPPGNGTYTWANGPAGVPNPGLTLLNTVGDTAYAIPVMSSNNYYATFTNEYGCTRTSMVTITRQFSPFLNITVPTCVTPDDTVQLVTDDVIGFSYNWLPGYGLSSTSGGVVDASPDSTTSYTVTVTYGVCSTSQGFTLNVPAIFATPPNPTLCLGDSVTIELNGSDSYLWNPSSGSIQVLPGNETAVAFPTTSTTYTVTGTVTGGCTSTSQIQVDVYPYPATPIIQVNGDTLVCSPGFSYQWFLNGVAMAGETSQTLILTSNGTYQVQVTNEYGCSVLSGTTLINDLSIESADELPPAVIFPNPSQGTFYIESTDPNDPVTSVEIYTAHGQCIKTVAFKTNGIQTIQLQASSGLYYVKLMTEKRKNGMVKLLLVE
jgi:hypothetical protein